jgi:hypothetical protein
VSVVEATLAFMTDGCVTFCATLNVAIANNRIDSPNIRFIMKISSLRAHNFERYLLAGIRLRPLGPIF